MNTFSKLAIAAGAGLLSATASAVPLTFDLTDAGASKNSPNVASTFDFSNGGIDLTVSAARYDSEALSMVDTNVVQWERGLGVEGGLRDVLVDGKKGDEQLNFFFSETVEITGISLWAFAGNDDAQVINLDTLLGTNSVWNFIELEGTGSESKKCKKANGNLDNCTLASFSLDYDALTTAFAVEANDRNDEFTVAELRIETIEVPEPASLALFGLGMIGMGLARRQQKQA